jgi:hypothetical protein
MTLKPSDFALSWCPELLTLKIPEIEADVTSEDLEYSGGMVV